MPEPAPRSVALQDWLLASDPSIRWQVMRDLLGAGPADVATERQRVATEGWGARLLAAQDANGLWAEALYSPKWSSTTYTLLLLHRLGLPAGNPQALLGCHRLWDSASDHDGGLNLAKTIKQPETCITGMLVLLASTYGGAEDRLDRTVSWLLGEQLPDGGWNCETLRSGSRHGSFHTTITVLEALLEYSRRGDGVMVSDALAGGREFFLRHRLFKSHRTGKLVDDAFARFPFPPQWHFDALRGLEHFRAVAAPRDPRLEDAMDLIRKARGADGSWRRYRPHPGRTWFELEPPGPSRWTTLRCLRVLRWWDHAPPL